MLTVLCLGILSSSLFGAAGAVTYIWPVAGVTAPTAAQARSHNSVVCDVVFGAADTAAVITHNMALPNATGLNGIPKITLTPTAVGTAAVVPFIAFTSANTITIDKNSTSANTSISVRVTIERPAGAVK